jgi:5-methylcytosine-specific restriction protein A
MHAQAAAIRTSIQSGVLADLPATSDPEVEEAAREGRALLLLHLRRERSPKLREKKINEVVAKRGCLECEVCGFDFERTYGERGIRYAEVHYVTPLHVSSPVNTRLEDLAILCANCHRMIHRGTHWLSPAELHRLVHARRVSLVNLGVRATGKAME